MEDLTELLKKREDLEFQISNTRNSKVLAEIAEIDAQISELEQQKFDAKEHREISDPKLLEEVRFHGEEKSRLEDIYFGNTYKIQNLENKIIHLSKWRRELAEKISTTRG
jgi:predicted  nucleic acid-binding Zn-ribbon protein